MCPTDDNNCHARLALGATRPSSTASESIPSLCPSFLLRAEEDCAYETCLAFSLCVEFLPLVLGTNACFTVGVKLLRNPQVRSIGFHCHPIDKRLAMP